MAEPVQSDAARVLLQRTQAELSPEIDLSKPYHLAYAPGVLDVMGGIAEYTGSPVCKLPIDRSVAVLAQDRADREIQVFSFNLFDANQPFTFRMSLDRMAEASIDALRKGFSEPGRKWARHVAGCLAILHPEKMIDLNDSAMRGINLVIYGDVPMHMGLGSSAALMAASMESLIEHFQIGNGIDSTRMCEVVERELIGSRWGSATQAASCRGSAEGLILRMQSQHSDEIPVPIALPKGFQIIGISSGVRDPNADARIQRHLRAASIAHEMILEKMREMGRAAGRELIGDPMRGFLANLHADDYKKFFRPYLVDAEIQGAADHHILEARRVRQFCEFIQQSAALDMNDTQRYILMDKAGHLMYASHLSYMNDARLGSDECDLLVNLVRAREKSGLYGARITGRGCGGTVAVLCETSESARRAVDDICREYQICTANNATMIKSRIGAK